MGVDLSTYRCRIGSFISWRGADVGRSANDKRGADDGRGADVGGGAGWMKCFISFCKLIEFIGSLTFIGMLLLMAGLESNPGPTETFIFRYQYLLIEIGTKVLRRVFDVQVGHNFSNYLATHTTESGRLQHLINIHKITAEQENYLPPKDKNPTSSNFDVTLLAFLLRNICGLRPPRDTVWIKPANTDLSVEANIARLRICRNLLMHRDTVCISDQDFDDKWKELCQILNRLNNTAGIGDLSDLISDAEVMVIDERLKERYLETIRAWVTMDCVQYNIQEDVTALKALVKQTLQGQCNLPRFKDIQKYLVDFYRRFCRTLPVSPLFKYKDENLLSIYKYPTMYSVKCNGKAAKEKKEIKCYEDIFCKDDRVFEEIYIVGDAGVGKTSFCSCMSFLWCYAKNGDKLGDEYNILQKDVEYMSKFEFVFYISLRDTCHTRIEDMIIEQLFRGDKAKYQIIDTFLRQKRTLILMDGLDEWVPTQVPGGKAYELPDRIYSKTCVYITTSRSYRIESVRLSNKDVDHKVEIKGIYGDSSKSYVEDVIRYMNKEKSDNKNMSDFTSDMKKCRLDDQLCIPIIASHLVVLWFEQTMTDMPRALIYANILEMLFERAEKRGVGIPPSTESKFKFLPDSLSSLKYLNKHVSILYNVCHLSFRSLFKQDENASNLVFTVDQLQDDPYCFTNAEIGFLCKIGILSKNEVFGCYSVEKLKISFMHKSYIEFFAALFISSSDIVQLFNTKWTLYDVLQSEHLILLLVGLFSEGGKVLFDNLYQLMSDDLSLCRSNAIFHYDRTYLRNLYLEQLGTLQNIVFKCFKEVSRSTDPNIVLKLEDFILDKHVNVDILKQLLLLNIASVKSIWSVDGKYYDEFDQIKHLQCLYVGDVLSGDYVKFTECMLHNHSTLHTVCIEGSPYIQSTTLIPELPVSNHHDITSFFWSLFITQPVRSLQHLTSLSLSRIKMQHDSLHNLVQYLSDNVLIENIKLSVVNCDNHPRYDDSDCTLTLNLSHHTKLTSLCLQYVYILCNSVNTSSLKSITLCPLSERIGRCYIDVFNCMKDSQLEHLHIFGSLRYMSDYNAMKTLTYTVKTLPYIKSLRLWYMKLPDDVLLQLNPDVTQVKIVLEFVTMSRQCFHCFIESFVNYKSVIIVVLHGCKLTSGVGETHRELSVEESVDYMSEYLTLIPTVNITDKSDTWLDFETRSCQLMFDFVYVNISD